MIKQSLRQYYKIVSKIIKKEYKIVIEHESRQSLQILQVAGICLCGPFHSLKKKVENYDPDNVYNRSSFNNEIDVKW